MYTNWKSWFAVTANFQRKIVHLITTIQRGIAEKLAKRERMSR